MKNKYYLYILPLCAIFLFNGKKYVIDHIIPHAAGVEAGGTTTFENAQLVCYDENKNKSDDIPNVTL